MPRYLISLLQYFDYLEDNRIVTLYTRPDGVPSLHIKNIPASRLQHPRDPPWSNSNIPFSSIPFNHRLRRLGFKHIVEPRGAARRINPATLVNMNLQDHSISIDFLSYRQLVLPSIIGSRIRNYSLLFPNAIRDIENERDHQGIEDLMYFAKHAHERY